MATGLFAIMCPECGDTLNPTPADDTDCRSCDRRFLRRFGHMIPVSKDERPPFADTSVSTASRRARVSAQPSSGIAEE